MVDESAGRAVPTCQDVAFGQGLLSTSVRIRIIGTVRHVFRS